MKKALAIVLCLSLVLVAATGATLAYFTDSAAADNVLTVGKVDGDLTEPSWNPEETHTLVPGVSYTKDPTITLEQDSMPAWMVLEMKVSPSDKLFKLMAQEAAADGSLLPGETFANKFVADKAFREGTVAKWFTGINHADWKVMNVADIQAKMAVGEDVVLHLGYQKAVMQPGNSVAFMTKFGMPSTVTSEMMEAAGFTKSEDDGTTTLLVSELQMNFKANFIQETGIDTIDAAYAQLYPTPIV